MRLVPSTRFSIEPPPAVRQRKLAGRVVPVGIQPGLIGAAGSPASGAASAWLVAGGSGSGMEAGYEARCPHPWTRAEAAAPELNQWPRAEHPAQRHGRPRRQGQLADPRDVVVAMDPVDPEIAASHAVLEAQPVDLLDLLPTDVAAHRERLKATFEGEHHRLGQAGVDHPRGRPMFFIRTSPGSSISPDSTTSTSGRLATSSADRSSGRATSVMTHPGLTAMMSSTRLPAPEVAVTITSISARCSFGLRRHGSWLAVVALDLLPEREQLGRLRRNQPQVVAGQRQQPRAHRADAPVAPPPSRCHAACPARPHRQSPPAAARVGAHSAPEAL